MLVNVLMGVAIITLSVVDIILTNEIISNGGKELNPIMVCLMKICGKLWWLPKITATILSVGILVWINHWLPLAVVCGVMAVVIIWNIKELKGE